MSSSLYVTLHVSVSVVLIMVFLYLLSRVSCDDDSGSGKSHSIRKFLNDQCVPCLTITVNESFSAIAAIEKLKSLTPYMGTCIYFNVTVVEQVCFSLVWSALLICFSIYFESSFGTSMHVP